MARKIFTLFAVSTTLVLAACNTVAGAGEDVASAGNCVEDVAEGRKC